jgi:hypothetical protein
MVAALCLVICFLCLVPFVAVAQQQDARTLVRRIVKSELKADAQDHSHWMFYDDDKVSGKSTVKLVVQTAQGDLSKTLEIDGHPLSEQQRQEDTKKMQQFVSDASVRQKQKQDHQQDAAKARQLTEMLPDGFLWTKVAQNGAETTLAFKSNPKFKPPTREAQVFAAMEGQMVVNTKQGRIVALKGTLTHNVDFGFGLLGQLEKGGTFDVERKQIGPKVWEITATHVHIRGHALIFKSIGEQQDEETSHYKPTPPQTTLSAAATMLNDGAVAKQLGVAQP